MRKILIGLAAAVVFGLAPQITHAYTLSCWTEYTGYDPNTGKYHGYTVCTYDWKKFNKTRF